MPGPPLAADNGQPKMQATLIALQRARASLQSAAHNKGEHRETAIRLIDEAIGAVNAGMQYAAAHPTEVGPAEGPAAPEQVDEVVPGAERQPHMARAIVDLREGRETASRGEGRQGRLPCSRAGADPTGDSPGQGGSVSPTGTDSMSMPSVPQAGWQVALVYRGVAFVN